MKAYEKYKLTHQIWLPKVPAHWGLRKIKYIFNERSEKGYPNEPLLVASQNMGVVPKEKYVNRTVEAQKDLHLLKLVKIGDFVISLRSFQGGIEYAYYQGIISPAYTIMVNNGSIFSEYFRFLAKSQTFINLLKICVTGIREGQNIDYEKLKNFLIPVPSLSEQNQIVKFLDWKISKINKLISLREQQISELGELKKAIINKAVTKGLDPNAPMKDSGIEWIGKIPAKWGVAQSKRYIEIRNGVNPTTEGNIPVYGSGKKPFKFCSEYKIGPTVLLGRKGSINNPVYVEGLYWNVDTAFDVKIKRNDFLIKYYYYLSTCFDYDFYMTQTAIPSMTQTDYNNIRIPIPNIAEQHVITDYLDKKCAQIDTLITNYEKQISELNELKTRLISDTVTGKIDVREIKIPDETGEEND